MKKHPIFQFLLILLFFTLLTFFFSTGSIFFSLLLGKSTQIKVMADFGWYAFQWMPWAFFTPLIIKLVKRCPLEGKKCVYSVPLHIVASLIFSFIQSLLAYLNIWIYSLSDPFEFEMLMYYFVRGIHWNFLTYWIIVGVKYMFDFYRMHRENALRASKLETQLTQAQLEVLKMQLHPHFLFNTLHAISALVYKEPKTADKMISRLSDLLRMSLESTGRHEVPLKEEMEFLKTYLEIEKTRFQDRLKVDLNIEPSVLDAMVPNMLLQPLVENAIRHGISPKKTGGQIAIQASRRAGKLYIQIRDDGKGFKNTRDDFDKGIGIKNTRERLEQLYGENHRFSLENGQSGGAFVAMEIPFRLSSPDEEEGERRDVG